MYQKVYVADWASDQVINNNNLLLINRQPTYKCTGIYADDYIYEHGLAGKNALNINFFFNIFSVE